MKSTRTIIFLYLFSTLTSLGQQVPTGQSVVLLTTQKGELGFPHLQSKNGWFYYQFDTPVNSNEEITINVSTEQYSYLYLLYFDQFGSIIDTTFALNPQIENKIAINLYLDNTIGTDFLCLLYSPKPLNIISVTEQIKQTKSSFFAKLLSALPNMLVQQYYDVRYIENFIGFSCREISKVVPIIVEIPHN